MIKVCLFNYLKENYKKIILDNLKSYEINLNNTILIKKIRDLRGFVGIKGH